MTDSNIVQRKFLIRPYSYIFNSLFTTSLKILALLLVQIVLLFISKSYSSLYLILAATCASVAAECLWCRINSMSILANDSLIIAVIQGIICGMLVPQSYPIIPVVLVVFFTMFVCKYFFGGFAFSWVNPSVFAVIVLWIIGTDIFPAFQVSFDSLASRNPSQFLIEDGTFKVYSFDSAITDFLNSTIFSLFKVSVPEGYVSLFWDNNSVIPAFRYNFITLISSIVLFCDNFIDLIIPGVFIVFYSLLVRLVSPIFYNGLSFQGDILLAILTGGTFFGAFFVLNWFATVPITLCGKVFHSVLSAIVMFFISGCGTSSSGMIFTILIANVMSIMIQQFECYFDRKKIERKLENYDSEEKAALQEL